MLLTYLFDQVTQALDALFKDEQIFDIDPVIVRISRFNVSAFQKFEPSAISSLGARPHLNQALVAIFDKRTKQFDVMGSRHIQRMNK